MANIEDKSEANNEANNDGNNEVNSEGDLLEREEEDKADSDLNYPGLDKRHGFFRAIKRNQVDREVYHRTREEWREQRKQQTDREVLEERRRKHQAEQEAKDERRRRRRDRQRPDRAVYQPPRARHDPRVDPRANQNPLYKLEIEVKPGVVWKTEVSKVRDVKFRTNFSASSVCKETGKTFLS